MSKKKEDEKLDLHRSMHYKILHAKTRARITDKDVYRLSKEFFSQLLGLEYEFTHEELIEELRKTYMEKKDLEQTVNFIKRMGKMEFTSNEFSDEELKAMLDELHEILDHLVQEEEKLSWFGRWKKRMEKKEEKKLSEDVERYSTIENSEEVPHTAPEKAEEEIPESNEEDNTYSEEISEEDNTETEKAPTDKLKDCLQKIKNEKDKDKRKAIYQEAIIVYELLDEKQKIEYYNDLLKIYYAINEEETKK